MQKASENDIARHAYHLWEQDGRPHGRSLQHWLQAERDLDASKRVEPVRGPEPGDSLLVAPAPAAPRDPGNARPARQRAARKP